MHGAVKRLGEPVIRTAVKRAMKELGNQFVLGETIEAAMRRARTLEGKGYTHSYDMLGEAALTAGDAERYRQSYAAAIAAIAKGCVKGNPRKNPGISVKLSALHPRYELAKKDRVMLRAGATAARSGAARPRGRHGLQHRCRGSRPPRSVARRDRSGDERPGILPAGTVSVW